MKTPRTYKERLIAALNRAIHTLNEEYYVLISTTWNPDLLPLITTQMRYKIARLKLIKRLRADAYRIEAREFIPKRFPGKLQLSLKAALPEIYNKIYEERKKSRTKKKNCSYIK